MRFITPLLLLLLTTIPHAYGNNECNFEYKNFESTETLSNGLKITFKHNACTHLTISYISENIPEEIKAQKSLEQKLKALLLEINTEPAYIKEQMIQSLNNKKDEHGYFTCGAENEYCQAHITNKKITAIYNKN
ncbi:hypothetical protein N9Z27_02725 [Alphaproteobacteria bacterium]|nr:hypothetical protein [Alphaproteobacteria bacterium]